MKLRCTVQMADLAEQCNEEHTRHLLGMQRGRLLVVLLDKLGLCHAARHSTGHCPHWGRSCMQGVPLQSSWLHALLLDVPLGHGVGRGSSQTRACRSAHAGHVSRLRLHDGLLLASCLHAWTLSLWHGCGGYARQVLGSWCWLVLSPHLLGPARMLVPIYQSFLQGHMPLAVMHNLRGYW